MPSQWLDPAEFEEGISFTDGSGAAETAEFVLDLTGVAGSAMSAYELWYGESSLSSNPFHEGSL